MSRPHEERLSHDGRYSSRMTSPPSGQPEPRAAPPAGFWKWLALAMTLVALGTSAIAVELWLRVGSPAPAAPPAVDAPPAEPPPPPPDRLDLAPAGFADLPGWQGGRRGGGPAGPGALLPRVRGHVPGSPGRPCRPRRHGRGLAGGLPRRRDRAEGRPRRGAPLLRGATSRPGRRATTKRRAASSPATTSPRSAAAGGVPGATRCRSTCARATW